MRKLKSLREALQNNEISTLISTLGAGAGPEFNVDDVQYGKIIIATDADSDGSHIRMLLFTLLYTYMPGLIQSGKVTYSSRHSIEQSDMLTASVT